MDEYWMSPEFDDWDDAGAVIIAVTGEVPMMSPESTEDYIATRSSGGVG
jgi:hypothetical protein